MRNKLKIRTGDLVKVISGSEEDAIQLGKAGFSVKNKVIVEGVNVVKKHIKPNANNPKGGITEKELPIHVSNISLVTSDGKATRVGYRIEKDKKVRFSKKSGEEI